LALETTICICALSTLAGVAWALINVHTGLTIGSQLIAWITYTSESAVHINTPTIVAHPALCTLILITTEPTIRGMLKTILAQADVGARCVLAAAFQADERVLQTLIHVNAGQSGWRKWKSWQAFTPEGAIRVCTLSIGTHACLSALIMVNTTFAISRGMEACGTDAVEAAFSILASATLKLRLWLNPILSFSFVFTFKRFVYWELSWVENGINQTERKTV
jgi:hypothetical protein